VKTVRHFGVIPAKKGGSFACWKDQTGQGHEDHSVFRRLFCSSRPPHRESASPHEVTLVEATLESNFLKEEPDRLVGDKAYDSDSLDETLEEQGIEMLAPHRRNRKKKKTQDGRKLRRYKRRWNIERQFAWLQNFRRLVVRYEYKDETFLGMTQLGCIVILLRKCL
jgi:transposase